MAMMVTLSTVCRNRAAHYKQTILKNIRDNEADGDVEFLILDYNSDDDLEEWVKANLSAHISSGLLSYYKTFEPQYFHRSHSRNMAFRLAKGSLICNVDADNYTGPGFASYLRAEFSKDEQSFLCAGGEYDRISRSDIGGRICVRSVDFEAVGGYDEEMCNYGFEDYDLIGRLEMNQLKKKLITDERYLDAIQHQIKDRITEEFAYKNIQKVMVNYVNPAVSKLLLLFLDHTYAFGTLLKIKKTVVKDDAQVFMENGRQEKILLAEGQWIKGRVESCGHEKWMLSSAGTKISYHLTYLAERACYQLADDQADLYFYQMTDDQKIEEAVLFYSELDNRIRMNGNKVRKIIKPNQTRAGAGIVYQNFNYTDPIVL